MPYRSNRPGHCHLRHSPQSQRFQVPGKADHGGPGRSYIHRMSTRPARSPRFALQFDPSRIPVLADRYSYPGEERIVGEIGPVIRERGYYTRSEFIEVWGGRRSGPSRGWRPAPRRRSSRPPGLSSAYEARRCASGSPWRWRGSTGRHPPCSCTSVTGTATRSWTAELYRRWVSPITPTHRFLLECLRRRRPRHRR
jgi:hypothetical protein